MIKLYKKDSNGMLRFWSIKQDGDLLIKKHGVLDGAEIIHEEIINGNSIRDEIEQAEFIMSSKIKKQIEKGYMENKDEALNQQENNNALGLPRPMLAKRFDKIKNIDLKDSAYQHKYNGHRCMIANHNGEKIAYSRNGKQITSIDGMLCQMDIPNEMIIDGELYCHRTPLQMISSWVKRRQFSSDKLIFVCYDIVLDIDFNKRREVVSRLSLGNRALVAPDLAYSGSIKDMLLKSISLGYEGLIIRPKTGYNYEQDKKSNGLIKVKQFFDDEFLVTNITESQDGWGILHCVTPNGKTFRASAPGTHEEKRFVLLNKYNYIGRMVRIEYANLTNDEIPFQPVVIGWRNKTAE